MQVYKAPLEEIEFLLEVFGYDAIQQMQGFEMFDRETAMAMIDGHAKFCKNEMLPLNQSGDQEGIHYDAKEQTIKTPKGFKELYQKYIETGLAGIVHPEEWGGSGAPVMLGTAMSELSTSTNKSFTMCPGLTHGLIEAIIAYGSDEIKQAYLPNLVSGEWSGTMCLTEPQCGTDLGLISTKAVPEGDAYRLTGTKIWITFGEHDLTQQIVHLVLARLPDAPKGIKGISLFVVPKYLINEDGSLGERNPVFCGGVEHKMGIHASPTCVINMEDAWGYLVGEPHKGMRAMFKMMNHARLNVGMEGVALGEIAYQTALAFAKDRRQSRSLNPERREMDAPADNIFVHPDVRRMLLNIKSTNEAMRALAYWTGGLIDVAHHHEDQEKREEADDLVALMTPIIKSYLTERGFQNIDTAMQVLGGSGYTTDWCIEQYLRDVRISLIYEGTNHIQALDLVGRKLPKGMGRLFQRFSARVTDLIRGSKEDPNMAEFVGPLKEASKMLTTVTMDLAAKGQEDPEAIGAIASEYLNLFAFVAMGYVWCCMVQHAFKKGDRFGQTKIKTARYFFNRVMPEIHTLAARIQNGKEDMMALEVDEFWSAQGFSMD